jgi:hypothetical protein
VNTQTLCDLARLHRSETLREAADARRVRRASRRGTLRATLAAALTNAGQSFLALGATLAKHAE